jgi:hypothetical protein
MPVIKYELNRLKVELEEAKQQLEEAEEYADKLSNIEEQRATNINSVNLIG